MNELIDISQTLRPGIAVWPGDTRFQPFWMMRMDQGDSCNVGSVTMSLHTGTHVDAPFHVLRDGESPANADLSAYVGAADVLDLSNVRAVEPQHLAGMADQSPERVLIKTGTANSDSFDASFAYFTPGAARLLVSLGVKLVGIDTPSVDKKDSQTMESHRIFASAEVAVLENLVLMNVDPGRYELLALPLKLAGLDASPVRAVLRSL